MQTVGYLDIETTGLSPRYHDLTVIGLSVEFDGTHDFIQLVGDEINAHRLMNMVRDVDIVYTYNGSRFDLPFIRARLGVAIQDYCGHEDLMYACWARNLRGGLKSVERQVGIIRELPDIDGWAAVQLWHDYIRKGCRVSLDTLLKYNKEDVLNLKKLRRKLQGITAGA